MFYFDDGYTEDGYLKEVPGLLPALRFKFRYALASEAEPAESESRLRGGDPTPKAKLLAQKILSWDARHPRSGEPLAVSAEVIGRLNPVIQRSLWQIVTGMAASDVAPDGQTVSTTLAEATERDQKN